MNESINNKIKQLEEEIKSLEDSILTDKIEIDKYDNKKKDKEESLFKIIKEKKDKEQEKFVLLNERKDLEKELKDIHQEEIILNKNRVDILNKELKASKIDEKIKIEKERLDIVTKIQKTNEQKNIFKNKIKDIFNRINDIEKAISNINQKIDKFKTDNLLIIEENKNKALKNKNNKEKRIEDIKKEIGDLKQIKEAQEKRRQEELIEQEEERKRLEQQKQEQLKQQAEKEKQEELERKEKERTEQEEERKRLEQQKQEQLKQQAEKEKQEELERKEKERTEQDKIKQQKEKILEDFQVKQQKEIINEFEKEKNQKEKVVEQKDQKNIDNKKIQSEKELLKEADQEKEKKLIDDLFQKAVNLYDQKKYKESIPIFEDVLLKSQKLEKKPSFLNSLFGSKPISSQAQKYILKAQDTIKEKEDLEVKEELERKEKERTEQEEERKRSKGGDKKENDQDVNQFGMNNEFKTDNQRKEQEHKEKIMLENFQKELIKKSEQQKQERESLEEELTKIDKYKDREKKTKDILNKKNNNKKSDPTIKNSFLLSIINFPQNIIANIARHFSIWGIDISDHSIELMRLNKKRRVVAYGRTILEDGIINNGNIIRQKEIVYTLKEAIVNAKTESFIVRKDKDIKAIVSLPESKTYIQCFNFDNKDGLYDKIKESIEKTIPLPIKDLYWDFITIENKDKSIRVICAAVEQNTIDSYAYFLRAAGVIPIVLDVEPASMARSLLNKVYSPIDKNNKKQEGKLEDSMIVDIGAKTTNITIYDNFGVMCSASSTSCAGFLFTQKIADKLNITKKEAEKIKTEKGFKMDSEITNILEKESMNIVNEIKQAIIFYKKDFNRNIKKIIISGGTALLPDIDKFFQSFFSIKVVVGNPLIKIKETSNLDRKKGVIYSNVIGLALRGVSKEPVKNGINLLPVEIKNKEINQQEKRKYVLIFAILIALFGLISLTYTLYYFFYK